MLQTTPQKVYQKNECTVMEVSYSLLATLSSLLLPIFFFLCHDGACLFKLDSTSHQP